MHQVRPEPTAHEPARFRPDRSNTKIRIGALGSADGHLHASVRIDGDDDRGRELLSFATALRVDWAVTASVPKFA